MPVVTVILTIKGYVYGDTYNGGSQTGVWPVLNSGTVVGDDVEVGAPNGGWNTDYGFNNNIVGYKVAGLTQGAQDATVTDLTGTYPNLFCANWEYCNLNSKCSIGQRLNDGNAHYITMHLPWTITNLNWPLMLIKGGLQLILELDDPNRALISGVHPGRFGNTAINNGAWVSNAAGPCTMTYNISNPRFLAMMSTPEPSQIRNYINRWNSDAGIVYYAAGLKIQKVSVSGGSGGGGETDTYIRFNMGVRSARKMYLGITSQHYSDASDILTACVDSFSTYVKTNAQYFQVTVGSHVWPLRRLQVDDLGLEAHWYWRSLNGFYAPTIPSSIEPYEWLPESDIYSNQYNSSTCRESSKFVLCVDFSRTDQSHAQLTGVDLSIVPLDVVINRVSGYNSLSSGLPSDAPIVYVCCIMYDMFIRLSSQQISVLA
jgi:hypothetical protein